MAKSERKKTRLLNLSADNLIKVRKQDYPVTKLRLT